MYRIFTTIFFLMILFQSVFSQVFSPEIYVSEERENYNNFKIIEPTQAILVKARELPPMHDNSISAAMPPVFSQDGWSCGQASSIGYNFTYELNSYRDLPSDTSLNQYQYMFTYNFLSEGDNDDGVYFGRSSEILRKAGVPTVNEFSGGEYVNNEWMHGYDEYYNAMHNRISDLYALYIGDEAGLLMLKSWLYNHFDTEDFGGLANIYFDLGQTEVLPEGTPEEGMEVMVQVPAYTGHAVTFVGWNDSIRWDYNNDGQYTNDLDINEDGLVNMRDWEIGGIRFVNSHGYNSLDSGYCYMMYKTFAEFRFEGGMANKYAYIMDVNENYTPQLTYRLNLDFNKRNRIKIIAGISDNINDVFPQHTIEFPVFNFQGGDLPMKGSFDLEDPTSLEFGLDMSPLLSYVNTNEACKYYIQVVEHDLDNSAYGSIKEFSVIDYTNDYSESVCSDTPLDIIGNGITTLSIDHSVDEISKPSITSEIMDDYTGGEPYAFQMEAEGGNGEYQWDIIFNYHEFQEEESFPSITGEDITPADHDDGFTVFPLNFTFPFYGEFYDTIYVHVDGVITFDNKLRPFPYQREDSYAFRNSPMIAPWYNRELYVGSGQSITSYHEDNQLWILWDETLYQNDNFYQLSFAMRLSADGEIFFYYQDLDEVFSNLTWITGLSKGDDLNFCFSEFSQQFAESNDKLICFKPQYFLDDLRINDYGLVTANPANSNFLVNLNVQVTDEVFVFDRKSFLLGDGINVEVLVSSSGDQSINNGDEVSLNLLVSNTGTIIQENLAMEIFSENAYVDILDGSTNLEFINPGETIEIENAFAFKVASEIPDQSNLLFSSEVTSLTNNWWSELSFFVNAPSLSIPEPIIIAGENGRFDVGESGEVVIQLINTGHASIEDVSGSVSNFNDPYISLSENTSLDFGTIYPGEIVTDTILVEVSDDAYNGYVCEMEIAVFNDYAELVKPYELRIGRTPVLIIDLDPNHLTGNMLSGMMDSLHVEHVLSYSFPADYYDYGNLFICLGMYYDAYVLTQLESNSIIDFIEMGGNVYLEGAQTWYYDTPTEAHAYFHTGAVPINWEPIYDIFGEPGTFTEEFYCEYFVDMNYSDYFLEAQTDAFDILNSGGEEEKVCAVAYEGSLYKSIASLVLFGKMGAPHNHDARLEYLQGIIDFFSIDQVVGVLEQYDVNSIEVSLYPNPTGKVINISSESKIEAVEIIDLHGQLMNKVAIPNHFKNNEIELKTGQLVQGIYFARILFENKTTRILKFIKL